jgi:hypothetical protein
MTGENDLERRRLAYRRAGYAVARYTQGHSAPAISAEGSPEAPWADPRLPLHRGPVDLGSRARHHLELQVLAQWAALLSESRACLGDGEPPGGWGGALDGVSALGRLVTRSDEENQAYLGWLRRRAMGLIDLPDVWAAIEALAEQALSAGPIGPRQAAAIIGAAEEPARRRSGVLEWFRGLR